ncbi:MAG: glycosyltransferase family 4 protein [Anaerolineae bacterium]|nr:glycosyltransferase family 4 protein [Anaerolineae bacterium]
MNILFVTHYYEPGQGEAAIRLARLAQGLQRRGHRVTVLTTLPHYPGGIIEPAYRGQVWQVDTRAGVRVIYSWLWATPSQRISRRLLSQVSFMPPALLRGLPLPRPDVTYIEAQPIFTGLVGRVLSRLKGAPYVLNVSDLWPDHMLTVGALKETDTAYRLARASMDSGYRGAAAITCMSPAWGRKIVQYLGGQADKIHTIYRGVDTTLFRPGLDTAAFRAQYAPGPHRLVTCMGTLATQYDLEALFAVARQLEARPDVQVLLIGTGSQRDIVRDYLATAAPPNLRWIDWLPHEAMPLAWCASHLNIWALRPVDLYTGTIPARLYEAFAAGTPVVAAQGGEAAALIATSGGGLTVPPGDTAGLAAAILRVLDDPALHRQMSDHARRYAEQHFDFETAIQDQEAILRQVAGQAPPTGR